MKIHENIYIHPHTQKLLQRDKLNKFISCICKSMNYFKVFPINLF